MAILYGMRIEAHNTNIDFKLRSDSLVYLNWMNLEFSEKAMLGFLEEVENNNYNEVLNLFGDKVDFDSSLSLVNNKYRAKKFINFHSRKYPKDRVKKIVSHMSNLMNESNLDFKFAQYSHAFFTKQEIDEAYINELVKSNNQYMQLASVYFAKNSFDKKKFLSFYKKNIALLSKTILNDRYVRRSIASQENKTE